VNIFEHDKSLLEGLAKQDSGIIDRIYRDNYTMVQSLILSNNGSSDDAADIFQEGMIVLYEKSLLTGFELNCQLKTFLYSVCRRLWLKKLQKNQRFITNADNVEDAIVVEEELELHEKREADLGIMEAAMNKIGEPCKSLLNAYYIQKKQMQQIAGEFGYTNADNAKTQKYKCLVRLKKIFFSQYKNIE